MVASVDLANLETGFRHLDSYSLRKAELLFFIMQHNPLVQLGTKILPLGIKARLPIQFAVKKTLFAQFCGGINLTECMKVVDHLKEFGVGTVLDFAMEHQVESTQGEKVFAEIRRSIDFILDRQSFPFVVFKPTAIFDQQSLIAKSEGKGLPPKAGAIYEATLAKLKSLCQYAAKNRVRVLIDAEESWLQPAIDQIAETLMAVFNQTEKVVYTTMQMYRKGRLDYLKNLIANSKHQIGIKLVRGAYLEKENRRAKDMGYESPIFESKALTDEAFHDALKLCLSNTKKIGLFVGSHNSESVALALSLMGEQKIAKNDLDVVFSQLYGMSDPLTLNLAFHGYQVCKYLPYGPIKEAIPYLMRRAVENTALAGQVGREYQLLHNERIRRAHLKN